MAGIALRKTIRITSESSDCKMENSPSIGTTDNMLNFLLPLSLRTTG